MSLVGFVATSHVAHQLYMKTATMIDLNGLNVYLHCIVHIFFKILDGRLRILTDRNKTAGKHPAIMTLPATKNHMVFRINQSLSTNRSGTGLLKQRMESPTSGDFKTENFRENHPPNSQCHVPSPGNS